MLGIAIINYKQPQKTIDCINSIFKTVNADYKIYLLDNNSADNSAEILENEYKNEKRVEFFKSDTNTGYANGNNLCLEKAKKDGCDYILISNNDIIFDENTVDTLLDEIQSTDCLAIAPVLKAPNGTRMQNIKKSSPDFKRYMMSETYLRNFDRKRKYQNTYLPKKFEEVYWISGAVFIADMKKFETIGFFDKNTFLYYEEFIISEKAVKKGYTLAIEPAVCVYHYHGASTGGNANLFTRLENLKSELYFLSNYKKYSNSKLRKVRFIRCLEVLFTFTKEHKLKDALKYIKESKKVLKVNKNEN